MYPEAQIDVIEDDLYKLNKSLLKILLEDKTTKTNIIWATDDYANIGYEFSREYEILPEQITGNFTNIIQPRICKSINKRIDRTKYKGEVFTPSWVCNLQNNLLDEIWFGEKDIFNTQKFNSWSPTKRIIFPKNKSWKKYIDTKRLEITCGEAPYLASRYDTVTGKFLNLELRIGLLDRKFRVIQENIDTKEEWIKWAIRAIQSVYGYEFQGDNLLLARENIFFTFIDNYKYRFNETPDLKLLKKIANIISWNIFQMDGFTTQVPFPDSSIRKQQFSKDLFDKDQNGPIKYYCKIFDWRSKLSIEFRSLFKQK